MFLLFKAASILLVVPAFQTAEAPTPGERAAASVTGGIKATDVEAAAIDGLMWLTRQQEPDGHWSMAATAERCPAGFDKRAKLHKDYDVGLTGLAVLALAHAREAQAGRTPVAVDAAFTKGADWLVAAQRDDGVIGEGRAFMYSQAIATRALVAAWRVTRDPRKKAAAQKAVDYVQAAQRPSPTGSGAWGWRYAARQDVEKSLPGDAPSRELYDSDTSITAWCAGALRDAREAGLLVDSATLDGAAEYARWVTNKDGEAGYMDPKGAGLTVTGVNDHFTYHPAVMNALATLTRLDAQGGRASEELERSMKSILADAPAVSSDHLSVDYYYWHHGSAALRRMRTAGGEAWTKLAVEHLLALQDRTAGACTHGAWVTGDRWAYAGGALYTTAINVLTLEDALGWY